MQSFAVIGHDFEAPQTFASSMVCFASGMVSRLDPEFLIYPPEMALQRQRCSKDSGNKSKES